MLTKIPSRDAFVHRHIGPDTAEASDMLAEMGFDSLDSLIDAAVPSTIRSTHSLELPDALAEDEALTALKEMADRNVVARSYLGFGYHDTITPPVILRNILENQLLSDFKKKSVFSNNSSFH